MEYLNTDLAKQIWENKYRYNNETLDEWFKRVSNNNPYIEKLIREKKFIFGGRILANRGTNRGSLSNCYSYGYVEDSLKVIMDANKDIALTFKAQGGQGLSLSLIRPKGTSVGDGFVSDGIIPFMEMLNKTTESISQGAGRRGALLMSLDITHQEAESFISIKSDLNKINNANLSLEIDDAFMESVKYYYETGEENLLLQKRNYGGVEYSYSINPAKIFKKLCEHAWKYAEPGVLFVDRMRTYTLNEDDDQFKIVTTNPCGEQPLIPGGCCCLSAINLSKYVTNPFTDKASFDYNTLRNDLFEIYKAMDDIVTEGMDKHPLEQQRNAARDWRNIGITTCGWADVFIKFCTPYGSEASKDLARLISKEIFWECLMINRYLGETRGSFPQFKPYIDYTKSLIVQNNLPKTNTDVKINALRNCSMLTIAPTGSISQLLQCSSGVEPNFALQYKRKTKSLHGGVDKDYTVLAPVVEEYLLLHPEESADELPWYFTSAYDIDSKDRIDIQSILQESVDSAISSTINLPKGTTIEQVEELYLYAWKKGLKGVTCYVDGSRDPILYTEEQTKVFPSSVKKRPKELPAKMHIVKAKGEEFAIVVGFMDGKPYETFGFQCKENMQGLLDSCEGKIVKHKKNEYDFYGEGQTALNLVLDEDHIEQRAITLLTSMALRHNADIKYIIETIKKINPVVSSFASAMCRVLSKYDVEKDTSKKCPKCGAPIIKESGCEHCSSCDYSLCNLIIKKHD